MPYDLGVWSEREDGDWEACVIASYLMGMIWGGWTKFPLGVYTQAEREALEVRADEPQTYDTTDGVALARYGVKLRRLSTGTLQGALARVGMGYVLAGRGAMNIPTTAPIHSIMVIVTSSTTCDVYDPLAQPQSAGVPTPTAKILGWASGAGPNQVREVRKDEFTPAQGGTDVNLKGSNPRPIHNRTTTLKHGGYLVADCTAMPYTNIVAVGAGSAFTPSWQVTGNEILGTKEWYGGWVFTGPGVAAFGYLSLGLFDPAVPLMPIENPPDPVQPTPPAPEDPDVDEALDALATADVALLGAFRDAGTSRTKITAARSKIRSANASLENGT